MNKKRLRLAVLVAVLAVGGPSVQGLRGQGPPADGACPGNSSFMWANLVIWDEKAGDEWTFHARPKHRADILTGHELSVQMERWMLNGQGQYEIADVTNPWFSDMTCLSMGAEWEFEMKYQASWTDLAPPCWKVFSGHVIWGTEKKHARRPEFGMRTYRCWGT